MDDQVVLSKRIKDLEKSVRFFSNDSKIERELWIAKSFIKNFGIKCEDNELIAVKNDPPDVLYKDARFEIKEIINPGRKRHDEYKNKLAKARSAKSPSELLEFFTPTDLSLSEIFNLCLNKMQGLHEKYTVSTRAHTDLLFYVNFQHVLDILDEPLPDSEEMKKAGWHSVSFIKGRHTSCCLFTNQSAPVFLQSFVGTICHRKE